MKKRSTRSQIGINGHFSVSRTYTFDCGEFAERSQREVEIDLFEHAVALKPDQVPLLQILAEHYTRMGHFKRGLKVDQKLVEYCPDDPLIRYNLACSYSLVGEIDKAVLQLRLAIRYGYSDLDHMMRDPDIENVRYDPRFEGLVEQIRKKNRPAKSY